MIVDENDLFSKTSLLWNFQDLTESVAHDCDDHVHKDYSNHECAEEEHSVCHTHIISRSVKSHIIISQNAKFVHWENRINWLNIVVSIKIVSIKTLCFEVVVEHIEEVCKGRKDNNAHEEEALDVNDSLLDKIDIVS